MAQLTPHASSEIKPVTRMACFWSLRYRECASTLSLAVLVSLCMVLVACCSRMTEKREELDLRVGVAMRDIGLRKAIRCEQAASCRW